MRVFALRLKRGMHHEGTKATKVSDNLNTELRDLRVLRGERVFCFHVSCAAYLLLCFSFRARRIFSGVIGRVFTRTPTASKMALLRTAAVGSMFSSPKPLAPKGPVGS